MLNHFPAPCRHEEENGARDRKVLEIVKIPPSVTLHLKIGAGVIW
ncbi:hypothetical protein PB2503_08029 [Parvularcula bermudensis HTCC2503]|uniref:Uncharacterized protein n=1 Tax=Parvularcula bermudensis (strain ATCC BAA-594 / HTCC2503 / KCTC 12087) TaxID=314260 RepID=E0TH77_PARBH|nr:hypothetical protein PB2503_08029 [Parvularcula bermudensis HTCC2503]